eukprot:6201707-Pleurochrysis_carterae.AAC.2
MRLIPDAIGPGGSAESGGIPLLRLRCQVGAQRERCLLGWSQGGEQVEGVCSTCLVGSIGVVGVGGAVRVGGRLSGGGGGAGGSRQLGVLRIDRLHVLHGEIGPSGVGRRGR